jgi:Helix-turn-helix domain
MDERVKLVARHLAGESMAELCREFGISRKTGCKIFGRYQECGIHGLTDRSRRPYRYANQLPSQVENHRSSPAGLSVSRKFTTKSGSSALCSMIWVTSIWRPESRNRSKTHSARKCYRCDRYIL